MGIYRQIETIAGGLDYLQLADWSPDGHLRMYHGQSGIYRSSIG